MHDLNGVTIIYTDGIHETFPAARELTIHDGVLRLYEYRVYGHAELIVAIPLTSIRKWTQEER